MNERILADTASASLKPAPQGACDVLCARCAEPMWCGAQSQSCWCQTLPSLSGDQVVSSQTCMCEACLLSLHLDLALDQKTMPRGALGHVGELSKQIARIQKTLLPEVERCALVVFAADHGVSVEGVSAYPKEVTWQMVENFRSGGAAINALTRAQNISLYVVDAGVDHVFELATLPGGAQFLGRKVAHGTANFVVQAAMSAEQLEQSLAHGREVVQTIIKQTSCQALGFGEMGIANTTSAAAMICRLLDRSPLDVVGRGTGIDDRTLQVKREVVQKGLLRHEHAREPMELLRCLGGFEIAQMVGAILEAARLGQVLVIDGFIGNAALLLANAFEPKVLASCVFSHQSEELGASLVLQHLRVRPLLNLGLRLGEGSGAALVMPLLKSAASILREMASFDSAQVSSSSTKKTGT